MIVGIGEKLHIVYRSYYEQSTRRHFIGEVLAAEGSVCRIQGFVFIYDERTSEFVRRQNKRTTIIDVAESGFIANIISSNINLEEVRYQYARDIGLIATDGKEFSLTINEFSAKS